MQAAVSQQGSLCGPNLTSQDFPWKWNVHWIAPMIEAPQTVALHPKQLDMSGCCFMKKRLFMPSDALPGKEPLGCSTRLGSCFPSPTPYHARIITMRRWGNGLGYEANDDVTWLIPHRCPERERVCIQGLHGEPPPLTLSILFPVAPPSRWPYCCFPKIIPSSQDGNDGA